MNGTGRAIVIAAILIALAIITAAFLLKPRHAIVSGRRWIA